MPKANRSGANVGGGGGGGGAPTYPWLPMFSSVVLGDFDRLDSYITAVVDNGDGDMTLTVDLAQSRTFPGNGDILYLDLGQHVKTAGSGTYRIETRITLLTRPTTMTGTPFISLGWCGGTKARTRFGMVVNWLMGATFDSGRVLSAMGTSLSAASTLGRTDEWILQWYHTVGTLVNQPGCQINAYGGTDDPTRWNVQTIGFGPTEAQIETGYDVSSGQFFALMFTQLSTPGAGTDTIRLKCEYRVVPAYLPEA